MYVNNKATLLANLVEQVGMGGIFNGSFIGLFQNDIFPTRNNVFADFTVVTFNGVTDWTAITWGAPFINGQTQAEVLGGLINWLTTSAPTTPVTAYGYVIVDSTKAIFQLAERFATPFIFSASGQHLGMIPRMVLDT